MSGQRKRMVPVYCTEGQIAFLDTLAAQWKKPRSHVAVTLIRLGVRSLNEPAPKAKGQQP